MEMNLAEIPLPPRPMVHNRPMALGIRRMMKNPRLDGKKENDKPFRFGHHEEHKHAAVSRANPRLPLQKIDFPGKIRCGKRNIDQTIRKSKTPFPILVWLAAFNAGTPIPVERIFEFIKINFPGCISSHNWKNAVRHILAKNANLFMSVREVNCKLAKWMIRDGSNIIFEELLNKWMANGGTVNDMGLANTADWEAIIQGTKGLPAEQMEMENDDVESFWSDDDN